MGGEHGLWNWTCHDSPGHWGWGTELSKRWDQGPSLAWPEVRSVYIASLGREHLRTEGDWDRHSHTEDRHVRNGSHG